VTGRPGARRISGVSIGRSGLLAAGVLTASILVLATVPQLLGSQMKAAVAGLDQARPLWLWLAAAAFLGSLVASSGAWRSALNACGAGLSLRDSCARYGIGSLVNTVVPYRIGDVVRVGLFARSLAGGERVWTTSGALGPIGAARALCLLLLVAIAAAMGALPLWPLAALGGLFAVALMIAILARQRRPHKRAAHLLDAFRALAHSPARATRLAGWVAVATVARVLAAAAIGAALGVHTALLAALLIVAALDLAGQLPLTPGNIGIASGTVAMTLASRGVALDQALSTGLAFHAVETATGLCFGAAGALQLAPAHSPFARRWVARYAAAAATIVLVTSFSLTVLVNVN
jgi:uncharacterized membrane protein YbhN (UPF0104 family)